MNDPFSTSFQVARGRLLDAAAALDARLEEFILDSRGPSGEELAIDVALVGNPAARAIVVVSSGLHGIEGFFGSAIQLAWMESLLQDPSELPGQTSAVLVHAINPFGFAWRRRCDEENVDLNRNYLGAGESYAGTPPGYAELDDLLNPPSPPGGLEPFRLRAMWKILRHGLGTLKNTVAVGQYEVPSGLFYGGRGPAASTRIVQQNFSRWIGDARHVVHIDLHSGLGAFGRYKLLLPPSLDSRERGWLAESFGSGVLESLPDGIAYPARGVMGAWLRAHLADRDYRFLGAEFGTHSILRVLSALRAENRAHHHCQPGEPAYERAKRELMECFCPRRSAWRQRVVEQGLGIIGKAVAAASKA